MTLSSERRRPLGTMIAYGFPGHRLTDDLMLARRLGATLVEALPDWKAFPDPLLLGRDLNATGLTPHSVHACWGRQSIRANRVDLASTDPATHLASVDDLRRCLDWAGELGAVVVVVHPGGFSEAPESAARAGRLADGLITLADHIAGTGVRIGVENMPKGVHPGSRMAGIRAIVDMLARPEVGLVVDTGHAHLVATCDEETHEAGPQLLSTHVHDNDGCADLHLIPGAGSIDWAWWSSTLDQVYYEGPIMLECIRELRRAPESIGPTLLTLLERLTGRGGNDAVIDS